MSSTNFANSQTRSEQPKPLSPFEALKCPTCRSNPDLKQAMSHFIALALEYAYASDEDEASRIAAQIIDVAGFYYQRAQRLSWADFEAMERKGAEQITFERNGSTERLIFDLSVLSCIYRHDPQKVSRILVFLSWVAVRYQEWEPSDRRNKFVVENFDENPWR